MAYIRKVKTASGATAVQIAHKSYGKIVKLEHIGSAHNEGELQTLIALAKKQIQGQQQTLFPEHSPLQKIYLRQTASRLLFDCLFETYNRLGFDKLSDDIFAAMCVARLVEPTSKLDSIRVLDDLGIAGLTNTGIHRCLKRIIADKYRDRLSKLLLLEASQGSGITLVLYDVTTLYFEIQKEDDYRKPGMSKERRLEPQITVGLLVDQNGFPLELHSFEGNKAETKTILPVMEAFKKRHNLQDITVVADAAMMSKENLASLTKAGYSYVVGSRLNKIPYDIAEFQETGQVLADGQIITTMAAGYRVIYQYRDKRAALDLRNIEKQIEKAKRIVNGASIAKKAKFLTVTTKSKKLNQALVDKAKALAGIKGYVTNLDISDEKAINYYHQLWHVEKSFRMSKSDLKARPIFHHQKDSIEAHLTLVMAALAVAKIVEQNTGLSIKKFVKILRPIRNGTVAINGISYQAGPEISDEVRDILKDLRSGH